MAIGGFSPDHVRNMWQHQNARERLKELGGVWVGPDLALEKKVVIPAQQLVMGVNLNISKKDLPDIEISRGILIDLNLSVRSFLAQSGIDIRFHQSNVSDEIIRDLNAGKNVLIPVDIMNHGQRAVELDGEIMRFFWVDDSKRLRGEELREMVKSEFIVDGEEGKDWYLADVDLNPNTESGVCIIINLQEKKYYIPNASEPVRIKNRRELPTVLQEIPPGLNINFEIGETPKVRVGKDVVGVINTGVYNEGQIHISSPLILGGEATGSGGHIRTEILNGLNYVEIFLYRK